MVRILLVVFVLLLGACSKERNNSANQTPSSTRPAAQPSTGAARDADEREDVDLSAAKPVQRSTGNNQQRINEKRPVSLRDQLLSSRQSQVVFPEDFEIGILQEFDRVKETTEILGRIEQFTKDLAAGNISKQSIHPDWLNSLQRSLRYHIERGNVPTSVRIGAIRKEGTDRVRSEVRFYAEVGQTVGSIYLQKSESTWLISDVQADFSLLGNPPAPRKGLFEPSDSPYLGIP